jgi:hypothetical protein
MKAVGTFCRSISFRHVMRTGSFKYTQTTSRSARCIMRAGHFVCALQVQTGPACNEHLSLQLYAKSRSALKIMNVCHFNCTLSKSTSARHIMKTCHLNCTLTSPDRPLKSVGPSLIENCDHLTHKLNDMSIFQSVRLNDKKQLH